MALLLSSALAACGGKQAACARDGDCNAGFICVEDACRKLCSKPQDCDRSCSEFGFEGETCVDGLCLPKCGELVPSLEAIDGEGQPNLDTDPATAGHYAGAGLRIAGANLFGARVAISGAELAETELPVALDSDTLLLACLPRTLTAGAYTLSVSNQAGGTCGDFELVQGEPGPVGTYTSGVGVAVSNGTISVDFGTAAGQVAGGDALAALTTRVTALETALAAAQTTLTSQTTTIATLQADLDALRDPLCPAGYTHDTGRSDIVLCHRGPDDLVRVGDVWVDRYEASVWSAASCSGTQYGAPATPNYPGLFPASGNIASAADRLFACSVAGVTPSRNLTWFQAAQACAASGKHLITDVEWQTAAAGTYDAGAFNGAGDPRCHTSGSGPRVTGTAGSSPGSSLTCISLHGVEDLIGNLREWTAGWRVAGRAWQTSDGEAPSASPWPSSGGYGSDTTWNLDGRANNGSGYANGLPAAMVRGGDFDDGASAGVFAVGLSDGPSSSAASLGFRCARAR